jgi:translation initiation factor 1
MLGGNSKLVYSTTHSVPRKEKPLHKDLPSNLRAARQKVTVRLDRKSRSGKSVTVVEGLQMPQKERESLLKQLKTRFGTGGTVKDTGFEIQGDHRDTVMAVLADMGCRPKRSGG